MSYRGGCRHRAVPANVHSIERLRSGEVVRFLHIPFVQRLAFLFSEKRNSQV